MRVLILGGGGTLGAFSAGALRALDESGWRPDACIGSSAGAINLLRWIAAGTRGAEAFWAGLDWKWLLRDALLHPRLGDGVLHPERFRARVEEGVDWNALMNDPRPLGFIVVDLTSGRVSVRGNRTETSIDSLRAVARGSYALPPLFPPVQLGHCLLADGGLLRNAPLEAALDLGATEIVYLCNVQVAPHKDWKRANTPVALVRYLDIYFRRASNIGFADAPIVEGRYHGVPFLTIAPPAHLDFRGIVGSMIPTASRMQRLIELGEASAREALAAAYRVGAERTTLLDAEFGPASVGLRRIWPDPSLVDGSHADGHEAPPSTH